jgi:hypothetical protein
LLAPELDDLRALARRGGAAGMRTRVGGMEYVLIIVEMAHPPRIGA